ncbi:hypothetical protein [Homoserinimonas sp. OAct 916]|uniref:5' nucleotidase, NT5C type n=1 Tax=Homoserinimonas sp. OAct 916 TaxID=2211450 RepID=UPI0018E597B3|nr:hypothetical protein [Homoserinimonas sp. OAct 916]
MTATPPLRGRKVLYLDLDDTMVDFASGVRRLNHVETVEYAGRYDQAPGIFSLMDPMPGALTALHLLAQHFDTYLLSTAPWLNPSAWTDKLLWVQQQFGIEEGTDAYKRLVLSHHKNLNRGDFLVDDSPAHGASEFVGEWLRFGPDAAFSTWQQVTDYLVPLAAGPTLGEAIEIARDAHAGQVDRLGVPYIKHPLEVMRRVSTEEQKIVAILHDVVEDSPVTVADLTALGFSARVTAAVAAITKIPGEPLETSMARVAADPLATVVKMADLSHNADPDRIALLPAEKRAELQTRYEESARLIGSDLDAILFEAQDARFGEHR